MSEDLVQTPSETDLPSGDHQIAEIVAVAMRTAETCGLTLDGATAFCDDPRIKEHTDAYGNILFRTPCECRDKAGFFLSLIKRAGYAVVALPERNGDRNALPPVTTEVEP